MSFSQTINLMRTAHLLFRHSNHQTMELLPRSGASVSQCVYFFSTRIVTLTGQSASARFSKGDCFVLVARVDVVF